MVMLARLKLAATIRGDEKNREEAFVADVHYLLSIPVSVVKYDSMSTSTKIKLIVPLLYAILAGILFVFTWPHNATAHHIVGVATTFVAFLLWFIARVQLGNAFSIGAKANYLVQTGVYSKLRHPVYYFSILAVVGIAIYVWSPLMLLPVVLLILLEAYRINKEEKVLADKFGKAYDEYRAKTWF